MIQLCNKCLKNKAQSGRDTCRSCQGKGRASGKHAYKAHKKTYCENLKCPLAGQKYEPYLLDVDHIDGNKANDDPSNFVTLCCVCHRRKTHQARDFVNIRYRETV